MGGSLGEFLKAYWLTSSFPLHLLTLFLLLLALQPCHSSNASSLDFALLLLASSLSKSTPPLTTTSCCLLFCSCPFNHSNYFLWSLLTPESPSTVLPWSSFYGSVPASSCCYSGLMSPRLAADQLCNRDAC